MDLQEMYAALEVSHLEEVEKNKKCNRRIKELFVAIKENREDLKKLEEEKEILQKVNEEYRLKYSKAYEDLVSAKVEISEAKIEVNNLQEKKAQLTEDLQFVGDLFAKASSENQSLKSELSESERKIESLKDSIEELNRQKSGNDESDSKLTNLETELKLLVWSHDLSGN